MMLYEEGAFELSDPISRWLPEFAETRVYVAGSAQKPVTQPQMEPIRVRHLLTHTSGIDADLFFPEAAYLERLVRECGTLFEPGEYISYSNGGMMVAGRLLEVVTGRDYHELLESEVFAAGGMIGACTTAERAILRSTAIGHFPDPATGGARPTGMFMLPRTWGPAGATPIGTVRDLLAFGGAERLLTPESIALMRTVTGDMGTPNTSPVGLGWLLPKLGDTTVLTMSGASPGGVAMLAVMPEHDLVYAAYGNDPRILELHDELLSWLAGRFGPVPKPRYSPTEIDLRPYAGTYRSNQLRIDVRVVDGGLEEQVTYEPADESQERIFTGFVGGPFTAPPLRYIAVGKDLFAPEGLPLDGLPPHYLVSYHGGAAYRCSGGRMTRRVTV
jgi:CubicO group peptidase (beta-lactamase class C family)